MSPSLRRRRAGKAEIAPEANQPAEPNAEAARLAAEPAKAKPAEPARSEPAEPAKAKPAEPAKAKPVAKPGPEPAEPGGSTESPIEPTADRAESIEPQAAPEPAEAAPEPAEATPEPEIAGPPRPDLVPAALERLAEFPEAILSWVAQDGYPMNVVVPVEVKVEERLVRFAEPVGFRIAPGSPIAITGSHIHPLPGGGFDERSHVTVWGPATARPRGRFVLSPTHSWTWDERELPPPAAYERALPRARAYYSGLSAERGYRVRPHMGRGWLLFRATRAPFLSATFVPVLLGIAVAARAGFFEPLSAIITVVAAAALHLGLNAANDVFDSLAGADEANKTPTRFSGGSRVIQNALLGIREMSGVALGCYAVAIALGLVLLALRPSTALLGLGVAGVAISLTYTMPPFKLVYRGLGEIATGIGFGPVMLLGAYVVQTGGSVSPEAVIASLPVGLLVAMILYVNEIPDRIGDATAGKRTLPVRWSKRATIRGWNASVLACFGIVVAGTLTGQLTIFAPLVLLAIPIALRVHRAMWLFYDEPYALMPAMAANIQLHLMVGVLLVAAYLLAMADRQVLGLFPYLW